MTAPTRSAATAGASGSGKPEALDDRHLGRRGDEGGVAGLRPLQAGLHRLGVEHGPARLPIRLAEGGGRQRLADAGVRPGDEPDHGPDAGP